MVVPIFCLINQNPEFATKTTMSYFFEEQQHVMFELYDVDSRSNRFTFQYFDALFRSDICTSLILKGSLFAELFSETTLVYINGKRSLTILSISEYWLDKHI